MRIIRSKLAPQNLYPYPTRYVEETDTVQVSYDGGTTWEDFPEGDPRVNNHTPGLPDTGTQRCDAAARISAETQAQLAWLTGALDLDVQVFPLVQGFLRLFTPLFTYIPYLSLVFTAMNTLATIGAFAMHEAFDDFDWDEFLCLVYNNLLPSGQLTSSGFASLLSDIASTYDSTQETVLYNLYSLVGFAGLNDQAYLRTDSGDCSACEETWCYTFDFLLGSLGWAVKPPGSWAGGSYGSGEFVDSDRASGSSRYRDVFIELACSSTRLTHIAVEYARSPGNYTSGSGVAALYANGSVLDHVDVPASPADPYVWTGDVSSVTTVGVFITATRCNNSCAYAGSVSIQRVTLRGIGANPFGTDNCM